MRKNKRIWFIVASSLVIAGLILFAAVMTALDWDFTKLNTAKYETNTYTVIEKFRKIHIYTEEADILFTPSEDDTCKVVCYEKENCQHIIDVQNESLYIRAANNRKWYEYIGINFSTPKLTVSIPQNEYDALFIKSSTGDVHIPKNFAFEILDISVSTGDITNYASAMKTMKIATSTGDIRVDNITVKDLNLTVSTGDIYLTDIQCVRITSKGSTGNISFKNVIAEENFSIESSTGDVKFDGCDASEIFVRTDTGNVTGSLLSGKIFTTKTSTGNIRVPQSVPGGKCLVTTSTGDIRLEVKAN